ncbi:MAG TPA: MarR family transcriptional regulator [Acidimicrobiales bacterium]|jgi:DNA-binding MarR family transcriptional regulator|nr:MarR family transcriptional regulator [Acidimicrobiales bacterium]
MPDRPDPTPPPGELVIWLLRRATRHYGAAVRSALDDAGHADLPQQGFWAVNALDGQDRTAAELVDLMQITKQAVSQLVDSLAGLGYVERHDDPTDGRRVLLRLSGRGRAAAGLIAGAAHAVEQEAGHVMGDGAVLELRRALEAFVDDPASRSTPVRRPPPRTPPA